MQRKYVPTSLNNMYISTKCKYNVTIMDFAAEVVTRINKRQLHKILHHNLPKMYF